MTAIGSSDIIEIMKEQEPKRQEKKTNVRRGRDRLLFWRERNDGGLWAGSFMGCHLSYTGLLAMGLRPLQQLLRRSFQTSLSKTGSYNSRYKVTAIFLNGYFSTARSSKGRYKSRYKDYFEAPSVPQVSEEPTTAGHVEGIPDDGTRSYPVDAGPSSYCYGGGPYDYDESGLADRRGVQQNRRSAPTDRSNPNRTAISGLKDDVDLEYYKFCGDARYKPSRERDPHRKKSPYAVLSNDHTYSCWPVIIIPYNLPPRICMSSKYIFLTMVISGHSNPKRLIDVYLKSLIKELLQLWHVGVRTYDHATDRAFIMRAALMWTVNDLPAYGMASGWSIAGVMGCPVCMDDTRAFHLQHGRKVCYFDCHR
ncbi:hypothetical protein Sango_1938400 [Sesamum angolense]|uniref:Uncharacterized protein n=1 Tax=Sesamum angolense TaxID=2727404 RepID=A0AAE1WEC3_9LAMI|nr:hypothetical protein Sango_1938400 [Sesamum angolense]